MTRKPNIAIDGFSSTGKSTLAKQLAQDLAYRYVDTGAMYRAVTLFAQQNNLIINNEVQDELFNQLDSIDLQFVFNETLGKSEIFLNGENVEEDIRKAKVAAQVSFVAAKSKIRKMLVAQQQKMAAEGAVVMDGRDIGTVVLPEAELKIFMTANPKIRAQRRFDELIAKGENPSFEEVEANLKLRDEKDSTRADSPLKQAKGAKLLDNSNLGIEEQLDIVKSWVAELI